VSFQVADALALPCETASVDRSAATQVLLHIPDWTRALSEMRRILAPGGSVTIGEIARGTIAVGCTDRELGRRSTRLACDQLRNGLVMRELPARLRQSGLDEVKVVSEVQLALEPDGFQRWFIEPSMQHFERIGGFSVAEVKAFLDDLQERARDGHHRCSRTHCAIYASRTAEPGPS
jgi:ubiquinone/menaquinone biosynthesis C-methylase UbiE